VAVDGLVVDGNHLVLVDCRTFVPLFNVVDCLRQWSI